METVEYFESVNEVVAQNMNPEEILMKFEELEEPINFEEFITGE